MSTGSLFQWWSTNDFILSAFELSYCKLLANPLTPAHSQPGLIAPASEWERASHFEGGVLKASRGLRPHFPGRLTDRTQDQHRLGQRIFRPERVVILQPRAFLLMKETNHDEDIPKTRTTSFSERPRDLSQL